HRIGRSVAAAYLDAAGPAVREWWREYELGGRRRRIEDERGETAGLDVQRALLRRGLVHAQPRGVVAGRERGAERARLRIDERLPPRGAARRLDQHHCAAARDRPPPLHSGIAIAARDLAADRAVERREVGSPRHAQAPLPAPRLARRHLAVESARERDETELPDRRIADQRQRERRVVAREPVEPETARR